MLCYRGSPEGKRPRCVACSMVDAIGQLLLAEAAAQTHHQHPLTMRRSGLLNNWPRARPQLKLCTEPKQTISVFSRRCSSNDALALVLYTLPVTDA